MVPTRLAYSLQAGCFTSSARRPVETHQLEAWAEELERDLELVGLVALYDPPRPEVPEAIRQCHQAGIRVTMVTGDYGLTAQAIAQQIGLLDPPADIVVLDDNFATIVSAVRFGRSVVANISKFLTYILASNVPAIMPFLAMVAWRIPAALTVLQILAVDLGTDLVPALALGAEPPEPGAMRQLPRRRDQPLLNRPLLLRAYLVLGLVEAALAMAAYLLAWRALGVKWAELQALAPELLHGTATPFEQAMQHRLGSHLHHDRARPGGCADGRAGLLHLGVLVDKRVEISLACASGNIAPLSACVAEKPRRHAARGGEVA